MADKKWYVLRTAGTKEKKAAEYLVKEIERHPDLQAIVDQVLVSFNFLNQIIGGFLFFGSRGTEYVPFLVSHKVY